LNLQVALLYIDLFYALILIKSDMIKISNENNKGIYIDIVISGARELENMEMQRAKSGKFIG